MFDPETENYDVKCPMDGAELVMSERQGVEIDYCPQCRGVWLDRGELDKILERAATMQAPQATAAAAAPRPDDRHRDDRYRDDDRHRRGYKKRESWLSDLFD